MPIARLLGGGCDLSTWRRKIWALLLHSRVSEPGNTSMTQDSVQLSKFISYILRHKPDSIGLTLDSHGWAVIDELVDKGNASGTMFSRVDLLKLVESSDKKRFSVSDDGQRIRAAQGHSVTVELGLIAQEPPSMFRLFPVDALQEHR